MVPPNTNLHEHDVSLVVIWRHARGLQSLQTLLDLSDLQATTTLLEHIAISGGNVI